NRPSGLASTTPGLGGDSQTRVHASTVRFPRCGRAPHLHSVSVAIAKGKHPVPFRTRKLSPSAPMVLRGGPRGRVGRRRTCFEEGRSRYGARPSTHVRGTIGWL